MRETIGRTRTVVRTDEEDERRRQHAAERREDESSRREVPLTEVAERRYAEPLEDVEDVEDRGEQLDEVTDDVAPADPRRPETMTRGRLHPATNDWLLIY